jgi:HK97 family phage major capsid protein
MALRALMIRKKLDEKKKNLEALRAKDADFEKREAELETAIDEAETDEEKAAVEEEVEKFENEKAEHENAKADLEKEVGELENELTETEKENEPEPQPEPEDRGKDHKFETREVVRMNARARKLFGKLEGNALNEMMQRDDVKGWIGSVRESIANKRAVTNAGLTIPEVFLGLLRENIMDYSKLYKHVNVQPVSGTGRQAIMGTVPEGIWTECCATLNELNIAFSDVEVDCYKVGGYFKICDATLEDSDIDLAAALLEAIGQAIGIALDKAILYGRNTNQTLKMPKGIVTRLVEQSQPADYPATARPWVDLHTTNVVTIANTQLGTNLFQDIITASGAAKGKYSRGEKVWVMNETTYTFLKAQALSINAAGAIVSGMEGTMPVVGGIVEVLDFMPDYVIVGGYFDLFTLAERAGAKFAQSEHVAFINDATVLKGIARYDGQPAIAEAFVAIGVYGTTPSSTMTFALDTANTVQAISIDKTYLAITVGDDPVQLNATTAPVEGAVTWESSDETAATVSDDGKVTAVGAGTATITATSNGVTASCTVVVSAA